MKSSLPVLIAAASAMLNLHFAHADVARQTPGEPLTALVEKAISTNAIESAAAIAQLRAAGPAGLDAMFQAYGSRVEPLQKPTAESEFIRAAGFSPMFQSDSSRVQSLTQPDLEWQRIRAALDSVGQQRDCYASHLYWYTNLDNAKAAARASGKPILSLRLLGKLSEEYSCANSRFFRTTLYPNADVSRYLREHFILHWQSVRPVPRITIDMGDGRVIERTITGNSIHYILDPDGNPIDALPGLYGAKTFLADLDKAVVAEQQASKLNGTAREVFLRNYHSTRLAEIDREWSADLGKVNATLPASSAPWERSAFSPPDAITAAPRAMTKSAVEKPLLRSGAETAFVADRTQLDAATSDALWQKIAALHRGDAALDSDAQRLVQFKQPPTGAQAALITLSKTMVETPMIRMLRNLQSSIAEDTVHNEYQLHSRIYEWMISGAAPTNLDALNSKIYAQLFLTPNSDPWLGLAPADVFSALDGGGLIQTKAH